MAENRVYDYVLTPEELEEIWAKYGKPGEIAPGTKATKKRNHRKNQQNIAESDKTR
ncbi:hypothetical protein [Desulforamulus hydrothermalis]|uniref:Small acid-soluble spore P family protein n=1 Tax=Desulforamulus hydrothermalis Lam5 = DSM 18033 TaxID=1121428 RepID=K8EKB1_9FIRM|nr:hypothetical protein [Desulforamulus hydrothermalis]CCO08991.1 Small acid-soluble spore P family protein [Desulforamulus hydrothermalis Lam5 = DSM 18033]SHG76411.1 hypothetical protein SAMN02745177_00306 [Desulforamulus hydrothermalis Lam5 = DSM 18033]